MTSRPKEPYSLIPLTNITGTIDNIASGSRTNQVFINFDQQFIAGNANIFQNPPANVPSMYNNTEAVGFFDSLHDFKSDFIDCQGNIKGDNTNVSYKKFGFSFLLNGGYPNLLTYPNLIIQDKYSYLNRIPRPLNQDNLENYFSIGNIYDVINNPSKGKVYILPATRSSTFTTIFRTSQSRELSIYNSLETIYDRYKDPAFGGKIKLIFDFQLNLFDIIKKSRGQPNTPDHFCILYTAETITDPAPKMKFDGISDVFGPQNFYFEILGPDGRKFNASTDEIYGNINTTFKNISIDTRPNITKNTNFNVEAAYTYISDTATPTFETIKMNSKANTIDTIKNIIRKNIETAVNSTAIILKTKFNIAERNRLDFYTDFNNDMNTEANKENYKKDYSKYYARKRLGDTLQGRICKKDKLQNLIFNQTTNREGVISTLQIRATTDAVLVTHDRMLFSYAVINKIPVILDLKDNMILYVPPLTTGGQKKIKNIQPKISKNNYPIYKSIKIGGNLFSEDEIDNSIDSIMNNIDSLIRFLYLFSKGNFNKNINFQNFIEYINSEFNKNNYKYAYLGEYANNTLILGSDDFVSKKINELNSINPTRESIRIASQYPVDYSDLRINPNFLIIYLDEYKNILITKQYVTSDNYYRIHIQFNYDGVNSDIYINPTIISNTLRGEHKFIENISNLYTKINEKAATSDEDIQSLYQEFIASNFPQQQISVDKTGGSKNVNEMILLLLILISRGGSLEENETNTSPYDKILNPNFNILYDTSNLAENNITSLYFIFSLLREYELSFVNYQEGIDCYYTKINESCILSDLIGETNLIPHNIELYVFLKLILRDYNEQKLTSINYALFEYYIYLFSLSRKNVLYSRFQNLKSYLNVFYTINITPENVPDIVKKINSQPISLQSWKYFTNIMSEAITITENIITENYNAEQDGNYDIIYNNVKKYSLKLSGFTEMRSDYLSKTLNIILSMMSKGLLKKYTDMLNSISGKVPSDVAGFVPKSYRGLEPQSIIQPSFQKRIAVGVGGKRNKRTRKNKKQINKRKSYLNTRKIHKKKSHKNTETKFNSFGRRK